MGGGDSGVKGGDREIPGDGGRHMGGGVGGGGGGRQMGEMGGDRERGVDKEMG